MGTAPPAAPSDFPNIPVWAYPGAWRPHSGADTIEARPRTITVRWLRDPAAEARPEFGGYRIYRTTNIAGVHDTTDKMVLVRRFSKQFGDSIFAWHFPSIDGSTPEAERIATFIDPDSSGRFVKVCRLRSPQQDPNGVCLSRGDSVFVLMAPPGPHDGFRTWYSVTYEARNTTDNDYLDLFVAGPFGERRDLPSGSGARAVLIDDVNGDGIMDLVVANAAAGTVSVFMGAGRGSFDPPVSFAVGTQPSGLAASDFDQDGHRDLAVANRGSHEVSILFGDGVGSFSRRADFGVGAGPVALAVGDVNRDAFPDLMVATSLESSCSLLLGQGDGSFVRAANLAGASASPTDVIAEDLNGDGNLDLVVGTFQGAEIWHGNGQAGFTLVSVLGGNPGAHSVLIADRAGDSRRDIVYGNALDGTLWIGVGLPGGTYDVQAAGQVGAGIAGLASGDLDADGRPDLVVANPAERRLALLRSGTPRIDLAVAGAPHAVQVGNLDADGLLDLVASDFTLGAAAVITGPKNLNHKGANVANDVWEPRMASADRDSHFFARAVEPTGGPTPNLSRVGVVPNPYRAVEAWNPVGGHELHFINLPPRALIRIYTLAGDLVRELEHHDAVRDFERWDLKNHAGRDVTSGIYMYRVEAGRFSFQSRFIVIR